jgi:hypothetical protein
MLSHLSAGIEVSSNLGYPIIYVTNIKGLYMYLEMLREKRHINPLLS